MINTVSRWKTASAFIALLVLSFITSNTALAQACSVNCLQVYSIDVREMSSSISGTVKLISETGSGAAARGAVVHAVWTRPDGSVFDQYANIGTRLRATFRLATGGAQGTYTLTVVGATKSGYTFDPDNSSILSKSITLGGAANQAPTAVPNADVTSGSAPLTVNFDSSGSTDRDGAIVAYKWNFGDGASSSDPNPRHTYNGVGNFNASLTVTDDMGATASSSTTITVTDSNAGCSSNCMSVDRISLSYKARKNRLRGLVWVIDEYNSGIRGAVVHAVWTLPDGSTVDQYKKTGSRMRAGFTLDASTAGRYTLSVVEVTKAGHTFDPDSSNVLTGSIDIAP